MEFQDYYAALDVARTASDKEIRTAYRKLARQHHPDVNPGKPEAEERFKQLNEAYEVLSDPEKRKKYDEVGSQWREYERSQRAGDRSGERGQPFDWSSFGGAAPGGSSGGTRYEYRTATDEDLRDLFGDEAPFSDFFEQVFGGNAGVADGGRAGSRRTGRRRSTSRPGAGSDLEHPVEVDLADAYRGTTLQLTVQDPEGNTRRLEVKIPAGVDNGSRVRVRGQGNRGQPGGAAGDLYLVLQVRPDARFERRGRDLFTEVRAPLEVLVLGGEARVRTPDGRTLALKVPAGTQDGREFRLRGQGMPRPGKPTERGDLHAELHPQLPGRLTARQRELFAEFTRAGTSDPVGADEPAGAASS
jgi:curved DNA-binding protein